MYKKITLLSLLAILLLSNVIYAQQISVTTLGQVYTQDFNSLANTGSTGTALPNGWYSTVASYRVGDGSLNNGGLYSFGTADTTDRALGSLGSGSATPSYGLKFVNNTGASITSITVNYTAELWRLGQKPALRLDSTNFSYNVGADSIQATGWTVAGNFKTTDTTATAAGAINGNIAPNRGAVSHTISGLSIDNGVTFWIRWTELNVSGTDDGLAIDDLSVSFTGAVLSPCTEPTGSVTALTATATSTTAISGSFTATTADGYLVLLDSNATVPIITDATTYAVNTTVGTATVIANGAGTTFSRNGLVPNTMYHIYVFPYNNVSCTGGPNYNTTAPANTTVTTLVDACPEPVAGVSNLIFTNVTDSTLTGKFNKVTDAAGYIVLYGTTSTLPAVRDSATYTVGQTVTQGNNTATVAYIGSDSNFTIHNLVAGTKYYAVVFAYTTCSFGANFKINFTNDANKQDTTTTGGCIQPDTMVSITVGALTANSISGTFVGPVSGADGYIVVYRKASFLAAPKDSNTYTVGGYFTALSGSFTDTSYVGAVLAGSATSFTISGLDANTKYYFAVIPYKLCGTYPNYNPFITYANNKASATTSVSTAVKINQKEAAFTLYPNPTNNGTLFVKFDKSLREEATLEVIDLLGRKLTSQNIANGSDLQTIDVSQFAKGTYLLNIVYKGTTNVSTFVVQ